MNTSDLIVLTSFVLVMIALFTSFMKHKLGREKIVSSNLIALSFGILFLGFGLKDAILTKSLISGIIAGTLLQPLLADTYLTRKTLFYRKEGWHFLKTPWWMTLLWGLATTQLIYSCFRMNKMSINIYVKYPLFLIAGSIYFYIFELFVNNLAFWWQRRNCWQPFGVALYATLSEIAAVGILLSFCIILMKASLAWKWVIFISIQEGILIAIVFRILCYVFYKKEKV